MKSVSTVLSAFALCSIIFLSACKDDDKDSACNSGSLTMTVNGESYSAATFNNTLLKLSAGSTPGKRMDIRAVNSEGLQLIISFSDLSTGVSGDGVSTDEYIPIEEIEDGTENTYFFTLIDGDETYASFIEGTLDITSCDAGAKTVSGTFSFSDGDFEVTNGTFTNVCYKVL